MSLDRVPQIVEYRRDAMNGMYPSANFYAAIVNAQNHVVAHRHREVYNFETELGAAAYGYSGTTTIARFRFRAGYGATSARVVVLMGRDNTGAVASTPSASVTFNGTDAGPFAFGVSSVATDDEPDNLATFTGTVALTGGTVYECAVSTVDYARVLGVSVQELGSLTVDEAINYYTSWRPVANGPIYDSDIQRTLEGLSKIWKQNGGTACHWGLKSGAARTRTSATPINIIDNSSTSVSTSTPGWTLDLRYRNSRRRTGVPVELAVYGSIPAGTGAVTLVDSGGATVATANVTSLSATWSTAAVTLPATLAKYDIHVAGDGTNMASVYAVSLTEYEA